MLTGFDHATVVVSNLDAAALSYAQMLGQAPVWRGDHPEHGTRAALFALSNALIELVGPRDGAPEADGMRAHLTAHGEGLEALAFRTADAAACSAGLRARGLRATAPQEGHALAADGGSRSYRTVELSPRTTRGLHVYAVERGHDLTPSPTLAPPAGCIVALDHVVIRTAAPDAALAFYRDGLGIRLALDHRLNGTRMLFFRTGGVTLEVIEDPATGDDDTFYGLAYRVRDLDAAHARLRAAGGSVSELRDGRKPGTRVFSVREGTCGVPTLILQDPARDP
jgi:catechol 2,3-dioxygenase-like lactoylglutathione lyase family enzyme